VNWGLVLIAADLLEKLHNAVKKILSINYPETKAKADITIASKNALADILVEHFRTKQIIADGSRGKLTMEDAKTEPDWVLKKIKDL